MDEKIDGEVHLRTQFQIDRIAFFSDAVIAIAITLLILEIKIPSINKNISLKQIVETYGNTMLQHLIALFICFISVGNLWISHHELFEFVKGYNKRLIILNLYFLFTVMLLPLSFSFNLDENNPRLLKILVVITNLFLCNLSFYLLLIIISHKKNLFYDVSSKTKILGLRRKIFLFTLTLLLVSLMCLVAVKWFYIPFIIPLVDKIITGRKRYQKLNGHKKAGLEI